MAVTIKPMNKLSFVRRTMSKGDSDIYLLPAPHREHTQAPY